MPYPLAGVHIGWQKPAKNLTAAERGRVKYAYYCRKIVWETISRLVCACHTAQVAIDMIYDAYGASTGVTTILEVLQVHPTLLI